MTRRISALLIGGLLCPLSISAQNISSGSDRIRVETYGNCTVYDEVDMLTDDVTHTLRCGESTFTDTTEIFFLARDDGNVAVAIGKGVLFHLEDTIRIAVRVDRGELRRGTWRFDSEKQVAYSTDASLFEALVNEIANGERVAMRVGEESGNARLVGSRQAVMDFNSRK